MNTSSDDSAKQWALMMALCFLFMAICGGLLGRKFYKDWRAAQTPPPAPTTARAAPLPPAPAVPVRAPRPSASARIAETPSSRPAAPSSAKAHARAVASKTSSKTSVAHRLKPAPTVAARRATAAAKKKAAAAKAARHRRLVIEWKNAHKSQDADSSTPDPKNSRLVIEWKGPPGAAKEP